MTQEETGPETENRAEKTGPELRTTVSEAALCWPSSKVANSKMESSKTAPLEAQRSMRRQRVQHRGLAAWQVHLPVISPHPKKTKPFPKSLLIKTTPTARKNSCCYSLPAAGTAGLGAGVCTTTRLTSEGRRAREPTPCAIGRAECSCAALQWQLTASAAGSGSLRKQNSIVN